MTSSLRDVMTAICAQHGTLTPEILLQESTPPDSALHEQFEWDDKIGGHIHRLDQARALIRSVRIIYAEADEYQPAKSVRAFVHVPVAGARQGQYMPTEQAMADPFLAQMVTRSMERDWKNFKRRWGHMKEFRNMITAEDEQQTG